jgi:Alpha/beta hydrolase domain
VGGLLKSNSPMNPLKRAARRAYLVGESQSGGYIYVYYKWIHQTAKLPDGKPVYDGFLIEDSGTQPSSSAIVNQCAAALASTDPQRMVNHHAEPLVVVNSQLFYPRNGRPPNSDTPDNRFMIWMTAGASHGWTEQYDFSDAARDDLEKAGFLTHGSEFGHFTCSNQQPEINLYMFEKSMYAYLDRWVVTGKAPPTAPDPKIVNGQYVLDPDGNILGGLRMPEMQAPIAMYRAVLTPSPDCTSAVLPFTAERLKQLYSTHKDYTSAFEHAADELVATGFLARRDAQKLIAKAKAAPVP